MSISASEYKHVYNAWRQRAVDCIVLWEDSSLKNKYSKLLSESNSFQQCRFYILHLFGFCAFIQSELRTLEHGLVEFQFQKNGRYRQFILPFAKNGIASHHKCCYEYLSKVPNLKVSILYLFEFRQ
jgi:hypothetical protein